MLVERALSEGWNDALEREVDDYENYLSTQLERLEDMEPAQLAGPTRSLMDGLAHLLSTVGALREAAEQGRLPGRASALRTAVDEAASCFRGGS